MQPVVHVDVEEWLARWIRQHLPPIIADLPLTLRWASNAERPTARGGAVKDGEVHVIVRDDAGPRRDIRLKDASVGVTVLGASRLDQGDVRVVAERLVAIIEARAPLDPASPVADVTDVLGPYNVPSSNDEARLYSPMQLTLVGRAL